VLGRKLGVGIAARADRVQDVPFGQDAGPGMLTVGHHGRAHPAG
jgi:hypothetical protein